MASTSRHQQLWHQRWKFVHGIDVSSHKWTLAQLLWLCFASQPYLSCWQCAVAGATSRGQREKCITRTRSVKPTADWAESAALLPSLDSQSGQEASVPPLGKVLPAKRWTSHLWSRAVHLIRESCAAAATGRKKQESWKEGKRQMWWPNWNNDKVLFADLKTWTPWAGEVRCSFGQLDCNGFSQTD